MTRPPPERPWYSADIRHRLRQLPPPLQQTGERALKLTVRYLIILLALIPVVAAVPATLSTGNVAFLPSAAYAVVVSAVSLWIIAVRARNKARHLTDALARFLVRHHVQDREFSVMLDIALIALALGIHRAAPTMHLFMLATVDLPISLLYNPLAALLYLLRKTPPRKRQPVRLSLRLPRLALPVAPRFSFTRTSMQARVRLPGRPL